MTTKQILIQLCNTFNLDLLNSYFRNAFQSFQPSQDDISYFLEEDEANIIQLKTMGYIEFKNISRLVVVTAHLTNELTTRTGKKKQYDLAKKILKQEYYDAGIFVFYDDRGHFRFSLVVAQYYGARREFSNYRRYTYFISPELPNKTFINQIGDAEFNTIEDLLKAFSIEAVSDDFYNDFQPTFVNLSTNVQGTDDQKLKDDFALLFVIRIIFLGFVQKKGWLGNNLTFIQSFYSRYKNSFNPDNRFYRDWLKPLFFEALNHPPGYQVAYGTNVFPEELREVLTMSPYLNGELFKEKTGWDDQGLSITDTAIGEFIEFLFQYNFTIQENQLYDEELELNPEFLGIIFERLVNKADGAVYTPRPEVDLMCRMALVKWLEKNSNLAQHDLYNFMFRNMGEGGEFEEYQKQGDFSASEIRELVGLLERVTICDPAAGSGAFEVGMLQVLEERLDNLYNRNITPNDLKANKPNHFERKKAIIANSLYGVEVKPWAVWINQLRLWLSLFIDMPDDFKNSLSPLLPNLSFKVRVGDSLVQRIGQKTFPISGHASLPPEIKTQVTKLKATKRDFFFNQSDNFKKIEHEELLVFMAILDTQIEEKNQELKKLLTPKPQQGAFDLGLTKPKQVEFDLAAIDRAKRERLEDQILELKTQKKALKDEHPFVWSIEYAEIFYDKDGFDIIIGNPPYVRQESISDPTGKLSPTKYKEALGEMLIIDFPEYFAKSLDRLNEFKSDRKPSGRSDLYTYFYVRSLRLLNHKGVHVFICSNAWLDVDYGAWLQQFLLDRVPIHFIFDNHARRSFASADVNTTINIMDAPVKKNYETHVVRFVAFKKPFEEVTLAENLLEIEKANKTVKNDNFRVYPITNAGLRESGSEVEENQVAGVEKYIGDKWGGKYLRAPDIYFTILEKGEGKLVKLKEVAKVRFGIKTGANDFFYLEPIGAGSKQGLIRVKNGAGWVGELEEEFLRPVLKSPRECRTISVDLDKLNYLLFYCRKEKGQLRNTKAIEYIEWAENYEVEISQGSKKGKHLKGFHKISSVKSRRLWYDVGTREIPGAIVPCSYRQVFCVFKNQAAYADKRLYDLNSEKLPQVLLLLNSVLYPLFLEINTRSYGGGGGPIDAAVYEIQNIFVVNPDYIDEKIEIEKQINREIGTVFEEYGCLIDSNTEIFSPNPRSDRRTIDNLLFDILELSEEERMDVYRAVCQLVYDRIHRAQSV